MKKTFWLLGLLSCIGLAAFVRFGNAPQPNRSPASLVFALPISSTELAFRPENQRRYTYSFRRQIELSGFANQVPKVAYQGKFTLDVIRATDSGFTAIAQSVIDGYAGKAAPLVRLTVDRTGKRITLQTEPSSDEELRQYVSITKDLVTLWDFAADTDTLGRYEATVENVPSSKGTAVQKKSKVKYLSQTGTEIKKSLHWLKWDEALGLPAEVRGEEQTRLGRNGTTLDTSTAYRIRFEGKSGIPNYSRAQLAKLTRSEALVLAAGKATDNPEYAKVNWKDLAETLRRLEALKPAEQLAAFGDLARLLKRDPSALAKALALLSAQDIHAGASSTLFKSIVGALATAGTAEGQHALLGLYQNPDCEISGKGVILTAFTTTQAAPTAETTAFLANEAQSQRNADVADGAAFALGSGLQHVANDAAMDTLMQIWQKAEQSGNVNAQTSALDAIGNSGRAEFFPILNGILQSDQTALQPKATFSLRFMNTADSRNLLIGQMNSTANEVRAAAVGAVALAPWAEQFRAPVQSCSGHEPVTEIQKACDDILHNHAQVAAK